MRIGRVIIEKLNALKEHATNIVRELRRADFQAYFAGGCVRDMLLGASPRTTTLPPMRLRSR